MTTCVAPQEISIDGELIRNILEQPQQGLGNAGTINIAADDVILQDRGGITALSSAKDGGNVQLKASNSLLLKNNSEISATAGVEGTPGDGGNININAGFIAAFPNGNNNITANAFDGSGGNINITTEGIFDIQKIESNSFANDNTIDASSQFNIDGNISINAPDTNPVQGATELPSNVVKPGETITQACGTNRARTGKNGLTVREKAEFHPHQNYP